MNMGRNLGTVWGITFFDGVDRLLSRPRRAEGPRKADHFTQVIARPLRPQTVVVRTANALQDFVTAKLAPPPTLR